MIQYLKRLKSSCVKALPMYGNMGVSTPSLYRESTDSLILSRSKVHTSYLYRLELIIYMYHVRDEVKEFASKVVGGLTWQLGW